jgi:hypothetical protein
MRCRGQGGHHIANRLDACLFEGLQQVYQFLLGAIRCVQVIEATYRFHNPIRYQPLSAIRARPVSGTACLPKTAWCLAKFVTASSYLGELEGSAGRDTFRDITSLYGTGVAQGVWCIVICHLGGIPEAPQTDLEEAARCE